MFKRVFRFFSSAIGLVMITGVPAQASPMLMLSARTHRPAPLVSAMFLVLAGMGISMLFDKRE